MLRESVYTSFTSFHQTIDEQKAKVKSNTPAFSRKRDKDRVAQEDQKIVKNINILILNMTYAS